MRTTVNVDDHVLAAARRLAVEEERTLGAVVEDALRVMLSRRETRDERPFTLPTFGGDGVQPGVDINDSAGLLDIMEGRDAAL